MKRTILAGSLPFVAIMVMAAPAFAQADPAVDAGASEAASEGSGEILVTARRREERLKDVPIAITAVSRADLDKAGVKSVKDLGSVVSGFTFSGLGNVSQPAIRGVSTTISAGGSENPNAFYLDGIYQVSQRMLNSDQPDIERIEVLKGPQGTLFGRNSTGGAIQVITRDPTFTPKLDANIEVGAYTGAGTSQSAARINARAFASLPIADDLLAVSISGAANYTQGYLTEDRTGRQTGINANKLARGKILLTPSTNLRIVASAYYSHNRNDVGLSHETVNGLSAVSGVPGVIFATQPWHRAYRGDVKTTADQYGGYLSIKLDTGIGTLSSLTGYTKTESMNRFSDLSGGSCPAALYATFRCLDTDSNTNNKEKSQELNFSSEEFGPLSFVAGLYYYDASNYTDNTANSLPTPSFRYVVKLKSYAAYGEVSLKPVESLTLTAGVRYSHEKKNDVNLQVANSRLRDSGNATTPRFTITYAVDPRLNVYASYSKGYKTGLTGVTNLGRPVAPEKNTAYEAGVKFSDTLYTANLAVFYYDYKNLQVQSLTTGITPFIQNAASAKYFGVDADVVIPISETLRVRGAVTWMPTAKYEGYTNASYTVPVRNAAGQFVTSNAANSPLYPVDVSGDRIIRAPKWSGSATLSYDDKRWDSSVTLAFSSAVDHDLARMIHQRSYATLAATAGYSFDNGALRLGIYGRNLTNKHYKTSGLALSYSFIATYSPPTELGVSLGYRF